MHVLHEPAAALHEPLTAEPGMRLTDHGADPSILRGATAAAGSHPEQIPRPPGKQVVNEHQEQEQGQQDGHEAAADPHQLPVETAELLLLSDGALLQLDQAVRYTPVLDAVLALGVADVAQELLDLVVAVHAGQNCLPSLHARL